MQQQRRCQQPCHDTSPIHLVIERIQLSAVMERIQDEGKKTEDVKMDRARRVPAAHENKEPDEQVQQTNEAAISLNGHGLLHRSGDKKRFKLASVPNQLVTDLIPQPDPPQTLGDLNLRAYGSAVNGNQQVAGTDARARGGGARSQLPGLGPLSRV